MYKNTGESLGELETASETRAEGECFHSYFEFFETIISVAINLQKAQKNVFFCFCKRNSKKLEEDKEDV